jgi:hypothetical protein
MLSSKMIIPPWEIPVAVLDRSIHFMFQAAAENEESTSNDDDGYKGGCGTVKGTCRRPPQTPLPAAL